MRKLKKKKKEREKKETKNKLKRMIWRKREGRSPRVSEMVARFERERVFRTSRADFWWPPVRFSFRLGRFLFFRFSEVGRHTQRER